MPRSTVRKIAMPRRKIRRPSRASRTRLGVAALALLIGLVIFGKLIGFLANLSKPYSLDGFSKRYSWDGSSNLNLIVKSKQSYLVSFNPQDGSLSLLKVPDETYVDVPLGFGSWPLRSVYDLGQAESPPVGPRLLGATASVAFGVPIDRYLIISGDFQNQVEEMRKNPLKIIGLIKQSQTDLSTLESLRFWWGVRGVRFDRLIITDLGKSNLTSWMLLPDGSRVLKLDKLRLNEFIQDHFKDSRLSEAGLSVGIFNTTDHPGLAEQAARVVNNMGGRVVFTSSIKSALETSVVWGRPSYTTTRLSQIFAPNCIKQSNWLLGFFGSDSGCRLTNSDIDPSRADVVVILGEDYFLRYNK